MKKTIKLEKLQRKIENLTDTFTKTKDVKALYALLKECHITLDDSLTIGKIPPYDIDIQKILWKMRDKIIKLGNDIAQKISSIES